MKVGAATLVGGIFGSVGTLCFFIAFATDYWLVASDNCGPNTWPTQTALTGEKDANGTEVGRIHVCTRLSMFTHANTKSERKPYYLSELVCDLQLNKCREITAHYFYH